MMTPDETAQGETMADDVFFSGWVRRFSLDIPGVVALLLKGRHAPSHGGPPSDVHLDVLVGPGPPENHPA